MQEITDSRPLKDFLIQGNKMSGLLDTRADVSCIAGKDWPSFWPTHTTENELMGFKKGGMQSGNAAEEKVRESLKPWRVVSSHCWRYSIKD